MVRPCGKACADLPVLRGCTASRPADRSRVPPGCCVCGSCAARHSA